MIQTLKKTRRGNRYSVSSTCMKCSGKFMAEPYKVERGEAKFCSRSCTGRYFASLKIKQNIPCKECGGMFHSVGTKQSFCSPGCATIYRVKNGLGKNTGVKWSEESRRNASIAQKKRFESEVPYNRGKKLLNRRGVNHHYFGLKRSEETRKKISKSKKGKMVGENSPHWKGGVTTENQKQRIAFSKLTPLIFQRDDFTCQMCDQYGGYLHADHIKPWADYPDLRLDIDNCRTLCVACHYYVTWKRKMPVGSRWGLHSMTRERG